MIFIRRGKGQTKAMERLTKIGKVKPKSSLEIQKSKLGIGFEKLDRNVFDPNKAYDKVAQIGVKWIRLQSGWQRTEKEKGVYDFKWLDDVIDNLVRRGLIPWICLCYGNRLYDEMAAKYFGAVGCPPIHTEEQKEAWRNYVKALVSRYKGKVTYFEVWNEPDGQWCWKHGVSGRELGLFTIDTAKAIKSANPDAKVLGCSVCQRGVAWLNDAFSVGMGDYIDYVTYHEYNIREKEIFERVKSIRAVINRYNPKIKLIMGETGSQSRCSFIQAYRGMCWTPGKQVKQMLRRAIVDFSTDVEFTSYFSCMDMAEALTIKEGEKIPMSDYGFFGLLGAQFDDDGYAIGEYEPKPAYYAYQALASIFNGDVEITSLPLIFMPTHSQRMYGDDTAFTETVTCEFKKPNGSCALAYWYPSDLLSTEFESTVSIEASLLSNDIKLVDLYDGTIYRLYYNPDNPADPKNMFRDLGNGSFELIHVPIKDYPMLLTFGDFID